MATMTPIVAPPCDEKDCQRTATQKVMHGDNGPVVGNYCGAHALKALRETAKQEGKVRP